MFIFSDDVMHMLSLMHIHFGKQATVHPFNDMHTTKVGKCNFQGCTKYEIMRKNVHLKIQHIILNHLLQFSIMD